MSPDSPTPKAGPPHPLALRLIERLGGRSGISILEVGAGSGRNTRALEAAGIRVVGLGQGLADGAISTHVLLHGSEAEIAARIDAIADHLATGAPLYGTFGSVRDARYGEGDQHGPHTFSPTAGDERGVAHTYFDEARLRALLERRFLIESLEECDVDEIAGTWAHKERPLEKAVHWFVVAHTLG